MVRQTSLSASNLVLPLFVQEGHALRSPIGSIPGQARLSIDLLVETAALAFSLGVPAVALFPALSDELKDTSGSEALNAAGLLPRCVRALKQALPELLVITDVALDPYSSEGHDGVVIDGVVHNDQSVPLLARMAVAQADAGADVVAPSDMMDGRVGAIRRALDQAGHTDVAICSYAVNTPLPSMARSAKPSTPPPAVVTRRPIRWIRRMPVSACGRSSSIRPKARTGCWSNQVSLTPTSSDWCAITRVCRSPRIT